jgi:hypothetical protein
MVDHRTRPGPFSGVHNPFWEVVIAGDGAQLSSLRFDAMGGSQWCANLLKTGSTKNPRHPVATITGAQSGYFDAAGQLFLSSSAAPVSIVRDGETGVTVGPFHFGAVRETWRLGLDGPKLEWIIEQTWLADTELGDAFMPGLFFAAQPVWGEATVFQLWDRDTAQDAFYGLDNICPPDSSTSISRSVSAVAGGWGVAKLLSHATPNGDLRAKVSHHLKKGEVLNCMSLLAQTPWCEPTGRCLRRAGESVTTTLTLEPVAADTGAALAVQLSGPLRKDSAVNRRFFDTYVNCGIIADTHDWRFGNEPSGYVAVFCYYMYSEMVKFGVQRGGLGPDCMDPCRVLGLQVERIAQHTAEFGTVGRGYQSSTSLDLLPAFLIATRDWLVLRGNRDAGMRLFAGLRRARREIETLLVQGKGMIFAVRDHANDYWDWVLRDGRIGFVNVLTWRGLKAFAEIALWLGEESEALAATALADELGRQFDAEFWSEEHGAYADWIDAKGRPHYYLYAGPQLQAITAGMVPPERARRVVDSIFRRRRELGPGWENCFSLQTNFYDAESCSYIYRDCNQSDVTRFGQTENGGCLVSWNYYWIGSLARVGLIEEAVRVWQGVVARFASTSLVEGCNIWDFEGRPSRTTFAGNELDSYEPFLADQGLVSVALPRWLLGIDPGLGGISVAPVLPESAYPATVKLFHLGRERTIEIASASHHSIT